MFEFGTVNDKLKLGFKNPPNYEVKNSYSIKIRYTDGVLGSDGEKRYIEKDETININDLNENKIVSIIIDQNFSKNDEVDDGTGNVPGINLNIAGLFTTDSSFTDSTTYHIKTEVDGNIVNIFDTFNIQIKATGWIILR